MKRHFFLKDFPEDIRKKIRKVIRGGVIPFSGKWIDEVERYLKADGVKIIRIDNTLRRG